MSDKEERALTELAEELDQPGKRIDSHEEAWAEEASLKYRRDAKLPHENLPEN